MSASAKSCSAYAAGEPSSAFERALGVSAEGYEESVSRIIRGNEGDVTLEFQLTPKARATAKAE